MREPTPPRIAPRAALAALLALALAGCSSDSGRGREVAEKIAAGSLDEAKAEVDRWLDRRPDDPEALAWAARVALARDLPEEAAEFSRKARLRGLPREELRDLEGMVLVRGRRFAEAEPFLRAHLVLSDGPEPLAAQALAEAGMATFNFGLAREAIARWKRDAPDDARPWLMEAEAAERVGDPAEQIADLYREALRLSPEVDRARLGLADVLRQDGRYDEAAGEYETYLRRNPDDPVGLAAAGLNELARGELRVAERAFARALESDPDLVDALKGLARVMQQENRIEEALGHLGLAAGIEPDDPEIAYQRSLLLARLGRRAEAGQMLERSERLRAESSEIERLRDAVVRDPKDIGLQYEIARWLIEHNHADEGIRWAEKALKDHPGHRPLCLLLADHYEAADQLDMANFYRWQAGPPADGSEHP